MTSFHCSPKITILVGQAREWLPDLVAAAKMLVVGEGSDPLTHIGPVITPQARNRIIQRIEDAIKEGATVALDGRFFSYDLFPNGNWLAPTVSSLGATSSMCLLTLSDYIKRQASHDLLSKGDLWSSNALYGSRNVGTSN